MHLVVERRIDAVPDQQCKADLLERRRERLGETGLVRRIAMEISAEVERRDLEFLVERVVVLLGQAIGVRLAHLVVAAELLVERWLRGEASHDQASRSAASSAVAASALPSRQPFSEACAITAAA